MALRRKVWGRLASDLKPRHLSDVTQTVKLEQLPQVFDNMLKAQTKGRIVVDPH
jgi:D-arabinose 1-dehydrogenase-like Zn-dependent alcohol dehydrogenase